MITKFAESGNISNAQYLVVYYNALRFWLFEALLNRAVVGGPAGQAMAGPVLGLSKQYIGL